MMKDDEGKSGLATAIRAKHQSFQWLDQDIMFTYQVPFPVSLRPVPGLLPTQFCVERPIP